MSAPLASIWPNPFLRLRLLAARLMIVAAIALLSACTNTGTVNWNVVQTTDAPGPCPAGATLEPPPGCGPSPTATPAPLPTGPDGKDYVPFCLPNDPPGAYCQAAP